MQQLQTDTDGNGPNHQVDGSFQCLPGAAFDGRLGNLHRWLSGRDQQTHWIAVDLEQVARLQLHSPWRVPTAAVSESGQHARICPLHSRAGNTGPTLSRVWLWRAGVLDHGRQHLGRVRGPHSPCSNYRLTPPALARQSSGTRAATRRATGSLTRGQATGCATTRSASGLTQRQPLWRVPMAYTAAAPMESPYCSCEANGLCGCRQLQKHPNHPVPAGGFGVVETWDEVRSSPPPPQTQHTLFIHSRLLLYGAFVAPRDLSNTTYTTLFIHSCLFVV